MNRNVFKSWGYSKRYYLTHPHVWLRHLCINIKHAYQRVTKGYCDEDWWDFGYWFLDTIPDMLDELAENGHGYPGDDEFDTYEKWQAYLHGLASNLRLCTEKAGEEMNEYHKQFVENTAHWHTEPAENGGQTIVWDKEDPELNRKYFDRIKEIDEMQDAIREETFIELARNLLAMWD